LNHYRKLESYIHFLQYRDGDISDNTTDLEWNAKGEGNDNIPQYLFWWATSTFFSTKMEIFLTTQQIRMKCKRWGKRQHTISLCVRHIHRFYYIFSTSVLATQTLDKVIKMTGRKRGVKSIPGYHFGVCGTFLNFKFKAEPKSAPNKIVT